MIDDTGYFLPCRTVEQAELLTELLNSTESLGLIGALAFLDSKRPITKALLRRVDLNALLANQGRAGLWDPAWESDWTRHARQTLRPSTVPPA